MARKRTKPKSPEQIAAENRAARVNNFLALNLQPEAANLAANEDILVEREVRPAPGERGNVDRARRLSGLDWLWHKKRIGPEQLAAGMKYADDYRRATDISLKSCIADPRGGDGMATQEKRVAAIKRLADARKDGLSSHPGMISLCDRIAGEGDRVSALAKGDDVEVKKMEAVLDVALDLLAKHYGMVLA